MRRLVLMYKLFERANSIAYIEECMYYYTQRKESIVNNITERSILDYIDAIFERYYNMKKTHSDLQLYNIYAIVNVGIKMNRWAIARNLY